MPRYRVGTDIGGTFTDLIVIDIETGQYRIGKTLTTPEDPSLGIETVFQRTLNELGIDPSQVENVIHGTTLVTNAMIERKGATTAVLATAGFRDALEIGKDRFRSWTGELRSRRRCHDAGRGIADAYF